MPGNYKVEDIRIKKTYRALTAAMFVLLSRRNFNQVTVNDICEEALVSRATFYAHFNDKYDLLKYLLDHNVLDELTIEGEYQNITSDINGFIAKNSKALKNVVEDANDETLEILYNFITSIILYLIKNSKKDKLSRNHVILTNFCTGGLISLLRLQIKNKFPADAQFINNYLIDLLNLLFEWDVSQQ